MINCLFGAFLPPRRGHAAERLICRARKKMQVPGRAVSSRQRGRHAAAAGAVFFATFTFIIVIKYETNWGKSNAQACECDSAERETRSTDARNGRGEHDFYGGGGIGAARPRGASRLADAIGNNPAGQADRWTDTED